MFPSLFLEATCFLFGLVVGSFLNVVIARVPIGRSIARPPSACPACGAPIRWYDNVPVLSWLRLRGRCRACQALISWRYPAVELVTADTGTQGRRVGEQALCYLRASVQTKAAELLEMTFRQFRYKLQKHHNVRRESGTNT